VFYKQAVIPALNNKCHILLLQDRNTKTKRISEIPVSSNEEDQGIPVEVQVKEHTLKPHRSDGQR
jgi:hypothetical protein